MIVESNGIFTVAKIRTRPKFFLPDILLQDPGIRFGCAVHAPHGDMTGRQTLTKSTDFPWGWQEKPPREGIESMAIATDRCRRGLDAAVRPALYAERLVTCKELGGMASSSTSARTPRIKRYTHHMLTAMSTA